MLSVAARVFAVDPAPSIDSLSAASGPINGGQTVSINGTGFANAGAKVQSISSGKYVSCAIYLDQNVYCVGDNTNGMLGNGTNISSTTPVRIALTGSAVGQKFSKVSVGGTFACALTTTGAIYCWGDNVNGQLGINNRTDSALPISPDMTNVAGARTFKDIQLGGGFVCALSTDAKTICWGDNDSGEVGNNTTTDVLRPVDISANGELAGQPVTSIATGDVHTCAVAAGKGYCWGSRDDGRLGNGTLNTKLTPAAVTMTGAMNGKTLASVTAGRTYSCALSTDGVAYCWGAGTGGQLGNGSTSVQYSPVAITTTALPGDKTLKSIAGGYGVVCAIASDDSVYCWGANNTSQLGDGTASTRMTPTRTNASFVQPIAFLSGGFDSFCSLGVDSQAYCWGGNAYGQSQPGQTTTVTIPTARVVPNIAPAVSFGTLSASQNTYVSSQKIDVKTPAGQAGQVPVTVQNYDGQTASTQYTYVSPLNPPTIAPSVGSVDGGNTVTVLGDGFSAQTKVSVAGVTVPNATYVDAHTLTFVAPASSTPGKAEVKVFDEYGQSAIVQSGYAYRAAQPVLSSVTPNIGPIEGGQQISLAGQNFLNEGQYVTSAAIGAGNSCVVYNYASIYCIGTGTVGQLGNGQRVTSTSLQPVTMGGVLKGKKIVDIQISTTSTCVLTADGLVYCWGANSNSVFGNKLGSLSDVPVATDTTGLLSGKQVAQLSRGETTTCAVTSEGKGYCWGSAANSAIGNGATSGTFSSPVAVDMSGAMAGKSLSKISIGLDHACGLTTDGSMYCWGKNASGQLGDQTVLTSAVPVAVNKVGALQGKKIVDISTGTSFTCALDSAGIAYCWGLGDNGRLGNGAIGDASAPVAVKSDGVLVNDKIVSIRSGAAHTCAVTETGRTACWGLNGSGQLGTGNTTQAPAPVLTDLTALAGEKPASIAMQSTGFAVCTLTQSHHVFCWGNNISSQLNDGTGTTTQRTVPTATIASTVAPKVQLDGLPAVGTTFVSNSALQSITPAHAASRVAATVTNYDGQQATLQNGYSYATPATVTGMSPTSGPMAGGDTVTITGTLFTAGMQVTVDGQAASNVTVQNDHTLTFVTPVSTSPGVKTVTVLDTYGQAYDVSGGYAYKLPAPTLTNMTPGYGKSHVNTTATINGQGFVKKPTSGTYYRVYFGGVESTGVTYVDAQTLRVSVPQQAPGTVDVTVASDDGYASVLTNGFRYTPSLIQLSNGTTQQTGVAAKMTLTAYDQNVPAASNTAMTIDLTTTSAGGQFATDLNESDATRWNKTSVVLPAGQTSVDFWYRDSISGQPRVTATAEQGSLTYTQSQYMNTPFKFIVSGVTNPIQAGVPSSVTVRVVDQNNAVRTDYTGTIHFTSNDLAAQLPPDYTMKASDYGIKTFTNGVVMRTVGTSNYVRATDSTDANILNQQGGITVTAPAVGTISKLAILSQPQSIAAGAYSAPISIQTQDTSGAAIPVSQDTKIYVYASSSSMQFSTDTTTWSGSVPFEVIVPKGSSTANIYVKDAAVRTGVISARDLASDTSDGGSGDAGWTNAKQTVKTGVSPATKLVVTGTDALVAGEKGTYTVQLQNDAGEAVTADNDIALRADSDTTTGRFVIPAETGTDAEGPVEFSIPAGSNGTTFGFKDTTVKQNGGTTLLTVVDARPSTDTIRLADGTQNVHIVNSLPSKVVLSASNSMIEAGDTTPVAVTLLDDAGIASAALQDTDIALSSSSATGIFSLSQTPFVPVSKVTIAKFQSAKTVYYKDTTAGTSTLSASSANLASQNEQVAVASSDIASYGIVGPSTVTVDTVSSPFVVSLYDAYGNSTTAKNDETVYLHAHQPSLTFSATGIDSFTAKSVTIPVGSASASFYVKDAPSHAGGTVNITASDDPDPDVADTGVVDASATVRSTGQAIDSIAFTNQPRSVTAGDTSGTMTVALRKADGSPSVQDGTTAVTISAPQGSFLRDDNGATTSASIFTVPAGASSVTFYYTGTKTGTFPVTALLGQKRAEQNVTVTPADATKLRFATNPQTVYEGSPSAAMTVAIEDEYGNAAPLTQPKTIELSTSCSNGRFSQTSDPWSPMDHIDIPAGVSSITFYYLSNDVGNCLVTASLDNFDDVAQTVTIQQDTRPVAYRIDTQGTTFTSGETIPVSVSLIDQNGNVTAAKVTTVLSLSADTTTSAFAPNSLTFTPGQSTKTFDFTETSAGATTITAHETTGSLEDQSVALTYTAGSIAAVSLSANGSAKVGTRTPVTVTLTNEFGDPVVASRDVAISLSSNEQSGSFYATQTGGSSVTSVTVPSGQQSITAYYTQTKSGNVTLTGALNGTTSGQRVMTFLPESVAAMQFDSQPFTGGRSLEIGQNGTVKVSLRDTYGNLAVTPAPLTLYVRSSHASASVVGSVTISAGNSSAQFGYAQRTSGDFIITVSDSADATTLDTGLTDISQSGSVVPGTVASFRFVPESMTLVRGATSQAVKVELLNASGEVVAADDDGMSVNLSNVGDGGIFSRQLNGSFLPTISLVFAPGQSQASFYYKNTNGSVDTRDCATGQDGTTTCTVTGQVPHAIRGMAVVDSVMQSHDMPVTLSYGEPSKLVFTNMPADQEANAASHAFVVEQQNQYGIVVPTLSDTPVYVTSNTSTGAFTTDKTHWDANSAAIKGGAASTKFYYRDSAEGDVVITAADSLPFTTDAGMKNASQSFAVTKQTAPAKPVDNFLVTNVSDPQTQGTSSTIVVVARDSDGFVVPTYQGKVHFTSSDLSAKLPGDQTFTLSSKGVITVQNGIAFAAKGEQTLTVRDEAGVTGSQTDITVLDANLSPIASVAIAQPAQLTVAPNKASQPITIELRDANGMPTTSLTPSQIRMTTTSQTGEYALTATGPWTHELIATVPAGFTYVNVYYRDATVGQSVLNVSDWMGGSDDAAIMNASLPVSVNGLYVNGTYEARSKDAFGQMVPSSYLYSSTADGTIIGAVTNRYEAFKLSDDSPTASNWRLEWRQGVNVVKTATDSGVSQTRFAIDTIETTAGSNNYFATAQATETTFDDPYSVVSTQHRIPVSPWVSNVRTVSVDAMTHRVTFATAYASSGVEANPLRAGIYVVPAQATSKDAAARMFAIEAPTNGATYTLNLDGVDASKQYRLLLETYDADGNVTSQALTAALRLDGSAEPEQPASDEQQDGNIPAYPSVTNNGQAVGTNDGADQAATPEPIVLEPQTPPGEESASNTGGGTTTMSARVQSVQRTVALTATSLTIIGMAAGIIQEVTRRNRLHHLIALPLTMSRFDKKHRDEVKRGAHLTIFFWISVGLSVVATVALLLVANGVSQPPSIPASFAVVAAMVTYLLLRHRYLHQEKEYIDETLE